MNKPKVMIIKTQEVKEVASIHFETQMIILEELRDDRTHCASFDEVVILNIVDLEAIFNTEEKKATLKEMGLIQ